MTEMRLPPAALAAAAQGDFENFMTAATPGGIEAQEAAGQKELVHNETLPKEIHGREVFEAWGVEFLQDADDLFVFALLPDGWKKKPTEHSMWTELLDEQGRCRAMIFYKAAFYDRSAHMSPKRFYAFERYGEPGDPARIVGADGSVPFSVPMSEEPSYEERNEAQAKLEAWAKENLPDYDSFAAYWE